MISWGLNAEERELVTENKKVQEAENAVC